MCLIFKIYVILMMLLLGIESILLLDYVELDTLSLRQCDQSILTLADDIKIHDSCGECVSLGISDMDDVDRTLVSLLVSYNSQSALVLASSDQREVAVFELDVFQDCSGGQVKLDSVVGLNFGVRVPDCPAVTSHDVRHAIISHEPLLHRAQLEFGFFVRDSLELEAALNVVLQSEMLSSSLDGDHIHNTNGILGVRSRFSVNVDQTSLIL